MRSNRHAHCDKQPLVEVGQAECLLHLARNLLSRHGGAGGFACACRSQRLLPRAASIQKLQRPPSLATQHRDRIDPDRPYYRR